MSRVQIRKSSRNHVGIDLAPDPLPKGPAHAADERSGIWL
jgi:hypothetical protein